MNKKDVLIGAVAGVILLVAGLAVGLSINGSSNGSPSLGAIASTWTNFGKSGVTTNIGYAVNNTALATTTEFIINSQSQFAPYPAVVVGDFVLAANGYGATITTSTALTPTQYCQATVQYYNNLTATVTTTLPSATSTYLACGNPSFGAYSPEVIINDSTNTVNFVAGTGDIFRCETNGVGTSTITGGCTSSQVSVLGSTTVQVFGYWTSSSTNYIEWGNNFH